MKVAVRSYDQLCPVAVALDVVGDRWTLLLLRDLLWHGPMRFGELDDRNPGLSTSLLTARLRGLERAALVERIGQSHGGHYRLTESGQAIRGVIDAFYEFGGPLLSHAPLRAEMVEYVVQSIARNRRRELLELNRSATVRLEIDGCETVIAARPGVLAVLGVLGVPTETDVDGTLRCSQPTFVALIAGATTLDAARAEGSATLIGDTAAVRLVTDLLRVDAPASS